MQSSTIPLTFGTVLGLASDRRNATTARESTIYTAKVLSGRPFCRHGTIASKAILGRSLYGTMKQEQRAETAELLEKTTQEIFDAVDCRDFDINSPIWANLADDFLIEVEHLNKPQKQTKDTYLYYLRDLMTENPDMRMKITSMETKISDNAATAETFSSIETTGMARMPDVKRDTLAIYTWKKTNGRWLLVKTKSLSGGLEY